MGIKWRVCVRLSNVKHVSNVSKIYTNMDEQILNRLVGVLREFKDENVTLKLFYEEKKLKFFMTNLPPRQHKKTNRRINNAIPLNELILLVDTTICDIEIVAVQLLLDFLPLPNNTSSLL